MNHFFERHNLPKLTQEEKDNLNRPISIIKESELIINFLKQKAPFTDEFTGEFYQTFKEEIIPSLYNLFHKTEAEGILPNSSYEARITLIPKAEKDIMKKNIH